MILYFRTPAPINANLMTIWDPDNKKKLLEIVPSAEGYNFVVKFLNSDPMFDVILPQVILVSSQSINSLTFLRQEVIVQIMLLPWAQ